MSRAVSVPELVPVLSAGKHRNPRKGACFMEMASYLAGERWSDHPSCTHPLLASLARLVNDSLPDEARPRIAGLIPDVVGLTGTALELDLAIAIRAGAAALPVAPATRQNVMAVGLVTCERMLLRLPDRHEDLEALCREAYAAAPDAHAWAQRYARVGTVSERTFRRLTAPHILAYAVEGIAVACVADRCDRLVDLLTAAIHDTAQRTAADRGRPASDRAAAPAASTAMTG